MARGPYGCQAGRRKTAVLVGGNNDGSGSGDIKTFKNTSSLDPLYIPTLSTRTQWFLHSAVCSRRSDPAAYPTLLLRASFSCPLRPRSRRKRTLCCCYRYDLCSFLLLFPSLHLLFFFIAVVVIVVPSHWWGARRFLARLGSTRVAKGLAGTRGGVC